MGLNKFFITIIRPKFYISIDYSIKYLSSFLIIDMLCDNEAGGPI